MKLETRLVTETLPKLSKLNIDNKAMNARSKVAAIDELTRDVLQHHPKANTAKVRTKLDKLMTQINRRQNIYTEPLTYEIQRARIDCLIFFYIVEYGWGKAHKLPSGAVIVTDIPVCQMMRLGFPTRYRVDQAVKRVRTICPEETYRYKQAHKAFLETCRRFNAARSEKSWDWYVSGEGNKNSVAYRTKVDLSHVNGWMHFRARRRFKYMIHELLLRLEERKRARKEMQEAIATMSEMRGHIFKMMGVPPCFRALV
jgi:hypothetical protein